MNLPHSVFHIPHSLIPVGVDEAGRGALAGPVVAGACVLPDLRKFPVKIGDSKALTPSEREESYEWLIRNCTFGVGMVDAATIDSIGIMASTERAMQEAVAAVGKVHPNLYVLVDGRDAFWFDWPHSSIVHGDSIEPSIGAASIIAKVTRDRWMIEVSREYSRYGFESHKGYGASQHLSALHAHGETPIHRRTFLRNIR
jgi:ribonuclease HII